MEYPKSLRSNRIIYQIDSFTREKYKGNPAGVVMYADGMTDAQLQSLARELNNSETAFLFPPDGEDCDGVIRYFTPSIEVPTCGHATVAAMIAMAIEENLDSCVLRMKTKIGVLPFEILRNDADYQVIMTQGKFELSPRLDAITVMQITRALGIDSNDLDPTCPVQIASTGHSKVMIGIKSREILNGLAPDFHALAMISGQIKCNGFFVFTFDYANPHILTHGRMFAPALGINEDPVTGNAHGPLGGYLIQNNIVKTKDKYFEFKGIQGEAMNRPGMVNVRVRVENSLPVFIQIKGEGVVIFRTEISDG